MKPKQLVWIPSEDEKNCKEPQIYKAETALGYYEIFLSCYGDNEWGAFRGFGSNSRFISNVRNISLEDAKRLCQEDFGKMVMACLEPSSDPFEGWREQ